MTVHILKIWGNENKMTKYEEIKLPELVKFNDDNKVVEGEYFSVDVSEKYPDSKALTYTVNGENKLVFLNSVAQDLIKSAKLKQGDKFRLTYIGMKPNKDKSQEYMDFKLEISRD